MKAFLKDIAELTILGLSDPSQERAAACRDVAPAGVGVQPQVHVVLQRDRQPVHEWRAGRDGVAVPRLRLVVPGHLRASPPRQRRAHRPRRPCAASGGPCSAWVGQPGPPAPRCGALSQGRWQARCSGVQGQPGRGARARADSAYAPGAPDRGARGRRALMPCLANSRRSSSACCSFSAASCAARKRRPRCWFIFARGATPSAGAHSGGPCLQSAGARPHRAGE